MKEIKTGWYKHTNKEFPKWRVFINLEEKTYHGIGVSGGKIKDTHDFDEMKDYVTRRCVLFNPKP